ncbi:adaptor-related protein complex 5, zeta 1 subunit [Elysia marginata]|uniref:Adaptor-related protein complex 5, zeta 1 subunit n=1 Tax=Elysia marginata TaxID=1093978 RepID=A0AAV4ILY7_9GAST|nr:adaptor-related protein complex 5, zeta 1 subunit [Elysia marginata]
MAASTASSPGKGSPQKAKETTREDISALCSSIEPLITIPEKSAECSSLLRQLFQALQTCPSGSSSIPSLPQSLIRKMLDVLSESPQLKVVGSMNKYLLCQMIFSETAVEVTASDLVSLAASKAAGSANMANLFLTQGHRSKCLYKLVPHAKSWLLSQDFESQKTGLTFLISDSLVQGKFVDEDTAAAVSERLSHWLSNTGLVQASNPRSLNLFGKDEERMVTEVDGTPSTNMFTVLNIGQYYTEEQLMNIHSFSCLYKWLCNVAKRFGSSTEAEVEGAAAAAAAAAAEDRQPQTQRPKLDKATVSKVLGSLVPKSVEYCFRLIDQCERKAKVQMDAELQVSSLVEAVKILDMICSLDEDQTARVFQEVKRLNTRISQESRYSTVLIYIVTFFFHHSAAVVHDPRDTYEFFFTKSVPENLNNQCFVTAVVNFVIKNVDEIAEKTDILTDYFPSIFKILAWYPRLFMEDFTSILPPAMNYETSVEIFHLLLDLPCVTASLEVMEKAKKVEVSTQSADSEPANAIEAFHNVRYKPLFLYMTRSKGGQGDTIDRLSRLHAVLSEGLSGTRVMVCCQVVIILLRIWFIHVLESEDAVYLAQLIPVIIERSSILVAVPELVADVHKIFANQLVALIKAYPSMVTIQQADIREFIQTTANMAGRLQIYSNLVYAVGEFASSKYSTDCTSETIGHFYESLEVVAYELLGQLSTQEHDAGIPKVLSTIVAALAKLASRCQDLIPRAILCLTKVVKQENLIMVNPTTKNFIVQKASSYIALLKNPDTASVILNPEPEIYTAKWHRNSTSMPSILRGIERILRLND